MKGYMKIILMCSVFLIGFSLAGCGAKKESSSSAALKKADSMPTMQEKVDYLVAQANAFYKSKEYKDAIELSQHVLSQLDSQSAAAKDVLMKAKEQLSASAQGALDDLKSKFGK